MHVFMSEDILSIYVDSRKHVLIFSFFFDFVKIKRKPLLLC